VLAYCYIPFYLVEFTNFLKINKKETKKEELEKKDDKITLEGVVSEVYPEMRYKVDVEFQGLKHSVVCYVSGKMRNRFIEIKKGDKVRIKISLYDIDSGIIVFRLTDRKVPVIAWRYLHLAWNLL